MKIAVKMLIIFILILSCTNSVIGCAMWYEIKQNELNKFPIIVYLNIKKTSTMFYIYLKNEGEFKGLKSASIEIRNSKEKIFDSDLNINKMKEQNGLYVFSFDIENSCIQNSKMYISAEHKEKVSNLNDHTIYASYDINIKDIYDIYCNDKITFDVHSLENKYHDAKLDRFLKTKFKKISGDVQHK